MCWECYLFSPPNRFILEKNGRCLVFCLNSWEILQKICLKRKRKVRWKRLGHDCIINLKLNGDGNYAELSSYSLTAECICNHPNICNWTGLNMKLASEIIPFLIWKMFCFWEFCEAETHNHLILQLNLNMKDTCTKGFRLYCEIFSTCSQTGFCFNHKYTLSFPCQTNGKSNVCDH